VILLPLHPSPSLHLPPSKTSPTLPTGASRPTRRIANGKLQNANNKPQQILQESFAMATQALQLVAQEVAQEQLVAQEAPQEVVTQATREIK
jgi:hypothetical protein